MKADVLVNSAKKYLGKPYVWGGESDNDGGYDCSGFMYATLKDAGYKTSRKTAQGFSLLGKKVALHLIKKGDLLFFGKSETKITHCAIYLGENLMIESIGSQKNTKNNKGRGVVISSLYRRLDLVLATRICEESNEYETGEIYTIAVDHLNVRYGPSVKMRKKSYNELTSNAKQHAYSTGQLKKGTKVSCRSLSYDIDGNLWMYIPSGWVCAIYNSEVYIV